MTDYVGEEALADWLDWRREEMDEDDLDPGGYCAATGAPLDIPWGGPVPTEDDTPLPI